MILAFRIKDYEMISDTANSVGKDIPSAILEACQTIGMDPNFYSNPDSIEDYKYIELVDIKLTQEEFRLIVGKANFHNYSVEIFVVEAVMMYRLLNSSDRELTIA